MAAQKGKLNLTIDAQSRKLAEQLAAENKRSLSNLFEILIEQEWKRSGRVQEQPPIKYGQPRKGRPRPTAKRIATYTVRNSDPK